MHFNVTQREIILKVVYYGPPLSGKTTNLQALHERLNPEHRGHLTVLDTADDRTLFFDLLPIVMQSASGYHLKLKLYTVPGQVIHAATRRIVLSGADAVAFIADSQRSESKANNEYWHGMRRYMKESGLDPDDIPTVIQFNKRDLPEIRSDAELQDIRNKGNEPVFSAVAIRGEGVIETLHGLLVLMFAHLNRRYDFENKFKISSLEFLKAVFGNEPPPVVAVG